LSERLIRLITRKSKRQFKEGHMRVVDKLRKQENLTSNEFWAVYETIWQEGPKFKYRNPQKWFNYGD
jgi:hypothetical protein